MRRDPYHHSVGRLKVVTNKKGYIMLFSTPSSNSNDIRYVAGQIQPDNTIRWGMPFRFHLNVNEFRDIAIAMNDDGDLIIVYAGTKEKILQSFAPSLCEPSICEPSLFNFRDNDVFSEHQVFGR